MASQSVTRLVVTPLQQTEWMSEFQFSKINGEMSRKSTDVLVFSLNVHQVTWDSKQLLNSISISCAEVFVVWGEILCSAEAFLFSKSHTATQCSWNRKAERLSFPLFLLDLSIITLLDVVLKIIRPDSVPISWKTAICNSPPVCNPEHVIVLLLPRDGRSTLGAYYPIPSFSCHPSHLPSYSLRVHILTL